MKINKQAVRESNNTKDANLHHITHDTNRKDECREKVSCDVFSSGEFGEKLGIVLNTSYEIPNEGVEESEKYRVREIRIREINL